MLLFVAGVVGLIIWLAINLVAMTAGTTMAIREDMNKKACNRLKDDEKKKMETKQSSFSNYALSEYNRNLNDYEKKRSLIEKALEDKGHPVNYVYEMFMCSFTDKETMSNDEANELFIFIYCIVLKMRRVSSITKIPLLIISNRDTSNNYASKQDFWVNVVTSRVLLNRCAKVEPSFDSENASYLNIKRALVFAQKNNNFPEENTDEYIPAMNFFKANDSVSIQMKQDTLIFSLTNRNSCSRISSTISIKDENEIEKYADGVKADLEEIIKLIYFNHSSDISDLDGLRQAESFSNLYYSEGEFSWYQQFYLTITAGKNTKSKLKKLYSLETTLYNLSIKIHELDK